MWIEKKEKYCAKKKSLKKNYFSRREKTVYKESIKESQIKKKINIQSKESI